MTVVKRNYGGWARFDALVADQLRGSGILM